MIHIQYNYGKKIRKQINDYREKHNIPTPPSYSKIVMPDESFLEEELLMVSSLEFGMNDSLSAEEIKRIISLCPNIKSLTITGHEDIQTLDLSALSQLNDLKLTSNQGLHNVIGLENKDLYSLTFYDNTSYGKTASKKLCEIALDNAHNNGTSCDLDIMLSREIMGIIENKNIDMDSLGANLKFTECLLKNGDDRFIHYDAAEIVKPYKKAQDIVSSYIKEGDTPIEKYAILYQWMCDNVKYDWDALNNSSLSHHLSEDIRTGKRFGSQGTVNALLFGTSVCQGYTNTMRLLSKMADIPSFDVHCFEGNQERLEAKKGSGHTLTYQDVNHSLLKVNLGGKLYYSDVTWDAVRYQNGKERGYFLLSYSDMSKDHVLYGESGRTSPSIDKTTQDDLLSFAKNRIKGVDQKKKLEQGIGVPVMDYYTVVNGTSLVNIPKTKQELTEEYLMMDYQIDHSFYSKTANFSDDYRKEMKTLLKEVYGNMIEKAKEEKQKPIKPDEPVNTAPFFEFPNREMVRKPSSKDDMEDKKVVNDKHESPKENGPVDFEQNKKFEFFVEKKKELMEQREELLNKRSTQTMPQYDEFGVEINRINEEIARHQQVTQHEVGRSR